MQAKKEVLLILDDGSRFRGYSFGYDKAVAGEVVFNTAMTGYPESLTDPSYSGQMMVLTYPLVGNYGVPRQTFETNGISTFLESEKIHAEAIIVSDYSENYSHWSRGKPRRMVEKRKNSGHHGYRYARTDQTAPGKG